MSETKQEVTENKIPEGWGKSLVSRKWHYFRNRDSLCRRIGFYFGEVEQGNDHSSDNCSAYAKILSKEKTHSLDEYNPDIQGRKE